MRPRQQQRDVRAESSAQHGGLAQMGESDIRVGHEHLGGVPTAPGNGGPAVAGEVEGDDRPGPPVGLGRLRVR